MQQLKRIPFTELKIDREFVAGAPDDDAARAMLISSIGLGKDLGLAIVAEGVETESEWRLVTSRGVDTVQGYFIARPMSADDMEGWFGRSRNIAPCFPSNCLPFSDLPTPRDPPCELPPPARLARRAGPNNGT